MHIMDHLSLLQCYICHLLNISCPNLAMHHVRLWIHITRGIGALGLAHESEISLGPPLIYNALHLTSQFRKLEHAIAARRTQQIGCITDVRSLLSCGSRPNV